MTGKTRTLPWWPGGEGLKTTENKIHCPRWVGCTYPASIRYQVEQLAKGDIKVWFSYLPSETLHISADFFCVCHYFLSHNKIRCLGLEDIYCRHVSQLFNVRSNLSPKKILL